MPEPGEFRVELNGIDLWFKIAGSGPVCLFPAPGWGPGTDLYFETMQGIEKFFTVVYLDTRGSGRSGSPPSDEDCGYGQICADFEAVKEYLGLDRMYLIGHSRGGWLAMDYALHYPDSVSGLILVDSTVAHDRIWKEDLETRRSRRAVDPRFMDMLDEYQRTCGNTDSCRESVFSSPGMAYAFYDLRNLEKMVRMSSSYPTASGGAIPSGREGVFLLPMEEIDVPVLILAGEYDDRASPVQAERIHSSIPDSRMFIIEKAGHFPWLENPESFYGILELELNQGEWLKPSID